MKHFAATLILAFSVLALNGCDRSHQPKSLSDIGKQLTDQFRQQNDSKPQAVRKLKTVQVTGFSSPPGNPHPYLGIAVAWEGADTIQYTGVPLIPLGDGLFGVTYQATDTKEELSAVISFR